MKCLEKQIYKVKKDKLVVPEAGRRVKWGVNANESDISLQGVIKIW